MDYPNRSLYSDCLLAQLKHEIAYDRMNTINGWMR